MNFIGNNNIRVLISFKSKLIDNQLKAKHYLDNLKIKFREFNYECCYFKKKKSYFILKGHSNFNIFQGFISNLGKLEEFEKKELNNSNIFFDIKFLIKKDIALLKESMKIEKGRANWIKLLVQDRLFQFKFFDTLSNYVYFSNVNCLRLYFKDHTDFNHAALEFANYVKNGGKDFGYPDVNKKQFKPLQSTNVDYFAKTQDKEVENFKWDTDQKKNSNQGMDVVKVNDLIEDRAVKKVYDFLDYIEKETEDDLLTVDNLEDVLNTFEND